MAQKDQEPKIVSDDDWKNQARKEKERLLEKDKPKATANGSTPPEPQTAKAAPTDQAKQPLPPASFLTLINTLAMQSLYFMGKLADPNDKQTKVDMDMAKHNIDLMQLLEDKTKGNLTQEESKALGMALHEVRMQYVQTAQP